MRPVPRGARNTRQPPEGSVGEQWQTEDATGRGEASSLHHRVVAVRAG